MLWRSNITRVIVMMGSTTTKRQTSGVEAKNLCPDYQTIVRDTVSLDLTWALKPECPPTSDTPPWTSPHRIQQTTPSIPPQVVTPNEDQDSKHEPLWVILCQNHPTILCQSNQMAKKGGKCCHFNMKWLLWLWTHMYISYLHQTYTKSRQKILA